MSPAAFHLTQRPLPGGDSVATLTLSAKMGSLGPSFWREAALALTQLSEARVLILRGEQVFSVGLDIAASAAEIVPALGHPEAFGAVVAEMHAVIEGVAALPIPVIAAVHGWCVGAGLELAAAADLRLCSADARFSLPEVKLGITADLGGLSRLPRLIGQGRAAHLALTAEPIGAEAAERWGLVTEVLPDSAALFARADALADHLARLPATALQGTKRVLHAAAPHAESLADAVRWNAEHMTSEGLQTAFKK